LHLIELLCVDHPHPDRSYGPLAKLLDPFLCLFELHPAAADFIKGWDRPFIDFIAPRTSTFPESICFTCCNNVNEAVI
jgi:hypothetical protein